jgi:hypothetical protein
LPASSKRTNTTYASDLAFTRSLPDTTERRLVYDIKSE